MELIISAMLASFEVELSLKCNRRQTIALG